MPDNPRIDNLRRRIQKDPASIAFAQLAEEYRLAGSFREAIEVCTAGLKRHPGYTSARVTLGRALLELGETDDAYRELTDVLKHAPENLAAIRGLAEVHRRRGELPEAIEQFKNAFELAGSDPGIEQLVRDLRREVGQKTAAGAPRHGASWGDVGAAAAATAADGPDQARGRRVSAYLHRWLEAIMAERRGRLYPAKS
ncbi:MAG: tetratricopeptide repeat protein [Acidobacteria bacterium]|nr:tetratricopeptide repeat protein [Acidobacteriota bacterium]